MAAAFALMRGRRGPVAAAMALGRRGLGGADPSLSPLTRRSLASGSGAGAGDGTGDGGMEAVCTVYSKEILDLQAEMLQEHHKLRLQFVKIGEDNVALQGILVANEIRVQEGILKLSFTTLVSGVGALFGLFSFSMTPFVKDSWGKKRKELTDTWRAGSSEKEKEPTLAEAMSPTKVIGFEFAHKEGLTKEEEFAHKEGVTKEEGDGALAKAKP